MSKTTEKTITKHDDLASSTPLGLARDKLEAYCTKIVAEGFVAAKDLRTQFGEDFHTRAVAYLYRNHRLLIEKRQASDRGDELGYMWANRMLSKPDRAKIPASFGFIFEYTSSRPKYGDYQAVALRCRWLTQALGATPAPQLIGGDDVKDLCMFEPTEYFAKRRNGGGPIVMPAYGLRAMFVQVLPTIGKEAALARRIMFRNVRLTATTTEELRRGTIDSATGQGLGIRRNEAIPAGTEFVIEALIPTTIIAPEEFVRVLQIAGQYVRYSPASHSGYGEFEVLVESAE